MTSRRGLRLILATSLIALGLVGGARAPASGAAKMASECRPTVGGLNLQTVTMFELTEALEKGRITSRELVEAYLTRIRAYDDQLNSIRTLNPDALRIADRLDAERRAGKVRGPLHGIPIMLKDNVNTLDMPTTAGSIALKGSIPFHAATITKKLETAGAIIMGKLNLSEFANWVDLRMPSGYSSLGGQVVNPYAFGDTPSGSSSGSGVAGAMAFASGTVGTETSGSILSPSNANSLVGIKPTTGLLSRYGIIPLAPSFDTPGPMVRNVSDAALMLTVMAGVDSHDPRTEDAKGKIEDYTKSLKGSGLKGARIGYSEQDREDLSADQMKIFDQALDDLKKQGAELVPTENLYNTSPIGLTEISEIPNEFKASLNKYLADETPDSFRVRTLGDIVAYNNEHPERVKYGQTLLIASDATPGVDNAVTQAEATATIASSQAAIDSTLTLDDLDAIIAPGPNYANISAAAGYPTVIVPSGYTLNGTRPMGLSFLGTGFSEPQLISFAYDYEQASQRRVPPTEVNATLDSKPCS